MVNTHLLALLQPLFSLLQGQRRSVVAAAEKHSKNPCLHALSTKGQHTSACTVLTILLTMQDQRRVYTGKGQIPFRKAGQLCIVLLHICNMQSCNLSRNQCCTCCSNHCFTHCRVRGWDILAAALEVTGCSGVRLARPPPATEQADCPP